jgi:hypothetical protein
VIHTITDGITSTGRRTGADVEALAVNTGLVGQTLDIRSTAGHTFSAIADKALRTDIIGGTDNTAEAVETLLVVEALDIRPALGSTYILFTSGTDSTRVADRTARGGDSDALDVCVTD